MVWREADGHGQDDEHEWQRTNVRWVHSSRLVVQVLIRYKLLARSRDQQLTDAEEALVNGVPHKVEMRKIPVDHAVGERLWR